MICNIKQISKFVSFGTLIVFLLIIIFFRVFGESIRDNNSPHVAVTPVTFYMMEGSGRMSMALPNDCFVYDDITGEAVLFYTEKRSDSGEEAFFAVKTTDFEIGKTDGSYTVFLKGNWANKEFIYKSNRPFIDGDRVVVVDEGELQ